MAASQLDPKLKEVYDRVMSTSVPAGHAPPPPKPQASPASPTPAPATAAASSPSSPHPQVFNASTLAGGKNTHGLSPVVWIVVGILFLLTYTIFWMKFFNLSLPFLPL